jgi:hypothetical protein
VDAVIACKRVLKWSYVYGYYLENEQHLEHGRLEKAKRIAKKAENQKKKRKDGKRTATYVRSWRPSSSDPASASALASNAADSTSTCSKSSSHALFDLYQATLEKLTDRLHELAEKPIKEILAGGVEMKTEIISLIRTISEYRTNVVTAIENADAMNMQNL